MKHHTISFTLNGTHEIRDVRSNLTLLRFLREQLGVMGVKSGCDTGECGACTVLLNGEPVNACLVLAAEIDGGKVITVEGLSMDDQLDPLQQTFIDHNGIQCGFCTPGVLISAKALLTRNPHPDRDEIKDALRGNLCRCTGYVRMIDAVEAAAKEGN
ncbi:MAG: (2Fe-2S)-binding protein [Anaerolineales bacterium]|nr:(2Fe-2S)-binding protein [Anaerolineales bacterium]